VSDRLVRFPGTSWQQIEALPQPLRWTVQRTIFHLLEEPVPTLADPFPSDDPLPGAYELHLAADDVTIWYTVTEHEGREVISVQHVSLDTWPSVAEIRATPVDQAWAAGSGYRSGDPTRTSFPSGSASLASRIPHGLSSATAPAGMMLSTSSTYR